MSLPWVHEVRSGQSPWDAFLRLADLPYVVFFDSAKLQEDRGRFSYITASPFALIRARGQSLALLAATAPGLDNARYDPEPPGSDDPLSALDDRLRRFPAEAVPDLPPFQGGAAGVFGYGLARSLEVLPVAAWDEFELPDVVAGIYDWVVAFDHRRETCHVVSQGFPEPSREGRARRAEERGRAVLARLESAAARPAREHPTTAEASRIPRGRLAPSWQLPAHSHLLSNFSRPAYLEAVERAIEYIRAGDIFQVNLSQRLLHPTSGSPVDLYERLREQNPAPFAGYFDAGDVVVASSSPEQFLTLTDGEVVTRPIKGTRARGYTPLADAYGRDALSESNKDRAENVMIVDLLRNDISRVCTPGTVKVPRLFDLEKHPTVHHLVSEVRGELRENLGALDLLRATFPGGSITGAPKVRAMEIIAELEPTARGPYCGSLAWVAFHGGMNSNILIRTMTLCRGWIQFPAGGGIVALSRPESEYQETLDKAAGMVRGLFAPVALRFVPAVPGRPRGITVRRRMGFGLT